MGVRRRMVGLASIAPGATASARPGDRAGEGAPGSAARHRE